MRASLRNAAAMLLARLAAPALSFAVNVGAARMAGLEVLGEYVHLLALLAIFQTAATAGMTGLLTREFAADPERTALHLRRGRTVGAFTGAAATLAFLAAAILAAPDRAAAAAVLALAVLPSAWIGAHEAFFMGTHTHHRVTAVAVLENALKLALALGTLRLGGGLLALCAGVAVSRAAALAVGAVLVRRAGVRGAWRPVALGSIRPFLREVAPFALLLVLSTVYFKLDLLLVDAVLGAAGTGPYGAALQFYAVALLVPDSAMAVLYPRLAARRRASGQGYAEATRAALRWVTLSLVPIGLGLFALADVVLRIAYGSHVPGAAPALRVLALSLPLHGANAALGQALMAGKLYRPTVGVVLAGLVAHALLCLVLLPRVGLVGAAASVIASSAVVAAGAWIVFQREVVRRFGLAPAPAGRRAA